MIFPEATQHSGCHHRHQDSPQGAAAGHHQVERREISRGRPQPHQFAMADHAHGEQAHRVGEDLGAERHGDAARQHVAHPSSRGHQSHDEERPPIEAFVLKAITKDNRYSASGRIRGAAPPPPGPGSSCSSWPGA